MLRRGRDGWGGEAVLHECLHHWICLCHGNGVKLVWVLILICLASHVQDTDLRFACLMAMGSWVVRVLGHSTCLSHVFVFILYHRKQHDNLCFAYHVSTCVRKDSSENLNTPMILRILLDGQNQELLPSQLELGSVSVSSKISLCLSQGIMSLL